MNCTALCNKTIIIIKPKLKYNVMFNNTDKQIVCWLLTQRSNAKKKKKAQIIQHLPETCLADYLM